MFWLSGLFFIFLKGYIFVTYNNHIMNEIQYQCQEPFTGLQRYHIMDEIQYQCQEPFTGLQRYHT